MPKYIFKVVGSFDAFDDIEARKNMQRIIEEMETLKSLLGLNLAFRCMQNGSSENILKRKGGK